MKKNVWLVFIWFLGVGLLRGQDSIRHPDFTFYLEDQLFFQLSYVSLRNLYPDVKQLGFSNAYAFGFIRDIPLNKRRNIGLGVGLGYGKDLYYQNLKVIVDETDGTVSYQLIQPGDYKSNLFAVKKLVLPVEVRLRTSTPEKYKFWRLYTGMTFSYVTDAFSEFENDFATIRYRHLSFLTNRWQYGIHFYIGYGELNAYIYYGLNDLFSPQVKVNGEHIPLYDVKFGIMLTFL